MIPPPGNRLRDTLKQQNIASLLIVITMYEAGSILPFLAIFAYVVSFRYMCLLDRAIGGSVLPFCYLAYLSSFILNQPLVANFFAYFDPKERLGSRDILFLICCPAHQSKDVKQELEKNGITPCEATSRRDMIPGRDRAFVFVSGGIDFASSEDKGGFYLRLVRYHQKPKKFNAVLPIVIARKDIFVSAASFLQNVLEVSLDKVSLLSLLLVDLVPIISNYALTRAKRRTECKGDPEGSFFRGCYIRSRFH